MQILVFRNILQVDFVLFEIASLTKENIVKTSALSDELYTYLQTIF